MIGRRLCFRLPRLMGTLLATHLLMLQSAAWGAPTSTGFALNRYQPAEPGSDWFQSESLDLRGHARPALGLMADFSHRPLVLLDERGDEVTSIVRYQFYYHLGANVIVADRLRLSASLPFLLQSQGGRGTLTEVRGVPGVEISSSDGTGVGDARFAADIRLVGDSRSPFTLALGTRVFAAIGRERHFASDGLARVAGRLMTAGQIGRLAYAAEVGMLVHAERDDFAGLPFGTDLTFGAAVGLRLLDGRIHLGPELYGSSVVSDSADGFLKEPSTPLELLLGAKFRVADSIRLGAAAGTGVTSGLGAAKLRVLAALEWQPAWPRRPPAELLPVRVRDLDGDGVVDEVDACPGRSGPARPLDRQRHGCPEPPDSDGDRVADDQDACPLEPGPAHADPARHGCAPLPDADSDGVADADDACPRDAGVRHVVSKRNGCPADADGDGIADGIDACPELAGDNYADPEQRGCPPARLRGGAIELSEPVRFAPGSAEISTESEPLLNAVAQLLIRYPELELLSVEAHTVRSELPPVHSKLGRERAEAVVAWLVGHGISARRLIARAVGSSVPVGGDPTPDAASSNRHIEFRILRRSDSLAAP